ncbi:MAG TPA: Flp family type IVb pilin [Acidobacteriota bacterium]|nr:Flp family type IVb pilin [Acidobacteriota bacterium]
MLEQLKSMKQWLSTKLQSSEEGVTIVEYAIMLVLVAVVVIIANPAIQTALSTLFSGISSFLQAGASGLS